MDQAKAMLAKVGKSVEHLNLQDVDYTTLENVPSLRKRIKDLETTVQRLKREKVELASAKARMSKQVTTWKGKMVQQLHSHTLQGRKYEAEIEQLRKQIKMYAIFDPDMTL